jgi:hypothetical protein
MKKLLGHCIKLVEVFVNTTFPRCAAATSPLRISGNPADEEELIDFQEQQRKILGARDTTLGLNFEIVDPTYIVKPTEHLPELRCLS